MVKSCHTPQLMRLQCRVYQEGLTHAKKTKIVEKSEQREKGSHLCQSLQGGTCFYALRTDTKLSSDGGSTATIHHRDLWRHRRPKDFRGWHLALLPSL